MGAVVRGSGGGADGLFPALRPRSCCRGVANAKCAPGILILGTLPFLRLSKCSHDGKRQGTWEADQDQRGSGELHLLCGQSSGDDSDGQGGRPGRDGFERADRVGSPAVLSAKLRVPAIPDGDAGPRVEKRLRRGVVERAGRRCW